MKYRLKKIFNEMFVWSCIGVSTEVAFTSIVDYFIKYNQQNKRLLGYTYLWMYPIYSLIPILFRLIDKLSLSFYRKISIITLVFMSCEYSYGKLLRKIAICPWEQNYKNSKYTIDNLVRYDWLPLWYIVSYIYYYRWTVLHKKLR